MTPDLNHNNVRLFVYQRFVGRARPPSVAETVEAFHVSRSAARTAFDSLDGQIGPVCLWTGPIWPPWRAGVIVQQEGRINS